MPCCIKIRRCCPSSIILLWLHNVGVVGVLSLISAEVFSCCGSPSSQWFTEVCCCREVRSHGVNIEWIIEERCSAFRWISVYEELR